MDALTLLIKPASSSCNLRCRYCFYADVSDSRRVKNLGMMTADTLEQIVRKALDEADAQVTFGFQGGEPTLAGLDFFKTLIELERKYNRKGLRIGHSLQTNGTCIDDEWAAFLAANQFLTGLSLDAAAPVHDSLRLDAGGKGTHKRCLETKRLLEKHGVEFNILSVVTRFLAAHPNKAYNFYKQHKLRYLQFIPCLDGLEEAPGAHRHSLDARGYGKFLCRLFDLWFMDYCRGDYVSIRAFDNYIRMLAGQPPENCAMHGVCSAYPLIEADGSVYPCDFYALDQYRIGHVAENSFGEMLASGAARDFMAPSRRRHPDCAGCELFFLCRGGCRRDREPVIDGVAGRNRLCEAYREFFPHALPRMRKIAERVFGG